MDGDTDSDIHWDSYLSTRRYLVVDDERIDRTLIDRMLRQAVVKPHVQFAQSIATARSHLARQHYHGIFLDNALPDGRGIDFATELSTQRRLKHIPVFLISDWPSPNMWQKAKLAGVRAVISKDDLSIQLLARLIARNRC